MSPNPEDKIDYRYLNLDTSEFVKSQADLTNQIDIGGQLKSITNYKHGRVLVAGSKNSFSSIHARVTCRRLSFDE